MERIAALVFSRLAFVERALDHMDEGIETGAALEARRNVVCNVVGVGVVNRARSKSLERRHHGTRWFGSTTTSEVLNAGVFFRYCHQRRRPA